MDFWVSQEAGNIPYEPWGNQFVPEYDANQVYNFSMIFAAVYEIALFWDTAVMMWAQQSGDILIEPFEVSLDSVELFTGQAEYFEIEPETADSMAGYEEGEIIPNGMQILGSYEFSDYLVLLGKWNGLTEQLGYPVDFVLFPQEHHYLLLSLLYLSPFNLPLIFSFLSMGLSCFNLFFVVAISFLVILVPCSVSFPIPIVSNFNNWSL